MKKSKMRIPGLMRMDSSLDGIESVSDDPEALAKKLAEPGFFAPLELAEFPRHEQTVIERHMDNPRTRGYAGHARALIGAMQIYHYDPETQRDLGIQLGYFLALLRVNEALEKTAKSPKPKRKHWAEALAKKLLKAHPDTSAVALWNILELEGERHIIDALGESWDIVRDADDLIACHQGTGKIECLRERAFRDYIKKIK